MTNSPNFQILSKEFLTDPYKYYSQLQCSTAVYFDENLKAYFISKYRDVNHILTDPTFTTKPLAERAEPVMGGRVLAQMEGPEHTNKRKLIVRELNSPATRKSFSDKILRIALLLLEPLVAKGKFDLVNDFGKDFAILVSMDILSLPLENYKKIGEWHRGIADFVTNFQILLIKKLDSIPGGQNPLRSRSCQEPANYCKNDHGNQRYA